MAATAFTEALSLHGLLGDDSDDAHGSSQDLFAEQSLAGVADNGLAPEDTRHEPVLLETPQTLPRDLMLAEDDALFNAPWDLLGDMSGNESLDSLFAQSEAVETPASQGVEQSAQVEAEAVMAAAADLNLQDTSDTNEEMLQLIQGTFIS